MRISHYELLQRIGRYGTTEIYRARDLRLDREVAIKLLRPEQLARPGAIDRFQREDRIASLVSHRTSARCTNRARARTALPVCELLEGRPLDELIAGTR